MDWDAAPDVVHVHDWHFGPAAAQVAARYGARLVATFHSTEAGRSGGAVTRWAAAIAELEAWLCRNADAIIVPTRATAKELGAFPAAIVPHGIDTAAVRPHPLGTPQRIRGCWGPPSEAPLVVFVGRLVPAKGADLLLRAASSCRLRPRLAIVGDGPDLPRLQSLARHLGIAEATAFAGAAPDTLRNALWAACDAAAMPSLYEPFGLAALEALAAGAPLVAASAPGLGEWLRGGPALLVPPGDVHALTQALDLLLGQNDLRLRLRTEGPRFAARFTWQAAARSTVRVYAAARPAKRHEPPPPYPVCDGTCCRAFAAPYP